MPTTTKFDTTQAVRDFFSALQKLQSQTEIRPTIPSESEVLALMLHAVPGEEPAAAIADIVARWREQEVRIANSSKKDQRALPGQAVAEPPSVVVTDGTTRPLKDVPVRFAVSQGKGIVREAQKITNKAGIATVGGWILGDGGDNSLIAIAGTKQVEFTAIAGGTLASMTATDQSEKPGADVGQSPRIKIADRDGKPIKHVPVLFMVVEGDGKIGPAKAKGLVFHGETDVNGEVSCESWTLGMGGPNRVVATAGSSFVEFRAEAK